MHPGVAPGPPTVTAVPGTALVVDGLVKTYGGRPAVDGLSFTVAAGTVLALLGPNGAGKTTTVEVCAGFRRPDAGRVRVLGDLPGATAVLPRVGVMTQAGGAYPGLRAGEMLRLVASYHRDPLEPAGLLERVGLGAAARTPIRRLSGGEKQRLSLAMAVVGRPELLFLDEPTAGLDPHARQDCLALVAELRDAGTAVVLTTHLMANVERLGDHLLVIAHGREVAAGTLEELTAAATLTFRATPGLVEAGLAAALPAHCTVAETGPGRYTVSGPVDAAALAAVTGWCTAAGVEVTDVRMGSRPLEDVYLGLVGPAT